jgi:hypothetical protein
MPSLYALKYEKGKKGRREREGREEEEEKERRAYIYICPHLLQHLGVAARALKHAF